MAQLNLDLTPELTRALQRLMRVRGIANESEAVQVAVIEAADREFERTRLYAARVPWPNGFKALRGAGLRAPLSEQRRFTSEDDLW